MQPLGKVEKPKGVLWTKVKSAYDSYLATGDLKCFAGTIAQIGDVRWYAHKQIVQDAIREIVPEGGKDGRVGNIQEKQ